MMVTAGKIRAVLLADWTSLCDWLILIPSFFALQAFLVLFVLRFAADNSHVLLTLQLVMGPSTSPKERVE